MVKPFQVLLTLLAVGALCALVMLVFPKDGIRISEDFSLKFANYDELFGRDTTSVLNVDSLLNSYEEELDSTNIKDSIQRYLVKQRQVLLNLQFATGAKHLPHFYQSLADLNAGKRNKVRIVHYGDSQIEGDRITSYVREKLQSEFGGSGPGMLPLMEFIPNMSIQQSQSDNWLRYTVFGRKDSTVKHNHFGLRGIISRFTPYVNDSSFKDRETVEAWVKLMPSRVGYSHVKHYKKLRLHYGYNHAGVAFSIKIGEEMVFSDSLKAVDGSRVFEYVFESTPAEITLQFKGKDSPDFYAISLESTSGIVMDNVAMRGSSGTIFNKISGSQLRYQYGKEPISLVILQYGGNTVPYIDSQKKADDYGRWFGAQIASIKSMLPNADVVLIGPSDMAIKEKTEYVTYPFLPEVRNALKKAAFDNGAAFWDIYEVMGGKNSMPSWVSADPPLAGPDYIHFTPKGAKRIAELFYKALYSDFTKFEAAQKAAKTKAAIKDSNQTKKDTSKHVD